MGIHSYLCVRLLLLLLLFQIEDFKKLNQLTNKVKNVVIIGGGFMGSELACALGNKGSTIFSSYV